MLYDDEIRKAMGVVMARFADAVRTVQPDQWDLPTPCDGWTVRDVVDHVVAGERFVVSVMSGAALARSVDASVGLDLDDDDVVRQLTGAAMKALDAFNQPLDQMVEHPVGSIPARLFMEYRIIDQLGHTWDIGQATGNAVYFDPTTVNLGLEIAHNERATLERSANFATQPGDAVETDNPVATLMRLMGRSAT